MTQQLNRRKSRPVPSSRMNRLFGFGMLSAHVAGRAFLNGMRDLSRGQIPDPRDLILTPNNILKVTDELARMRGAAMKLGQLVSMDAGEFLPPELADLMARLRADADFMPAAQINRVLVKNLGADWRGKLAHFDMQPIAAASIGQVHRARDLDGRELVVKIQYPGIADSIDSDIDNAAALFRMSGMLPSKQKLAPLIAEAKRQLRVETDYRQEAENLRSFRSLLSDEDAFLIPEVINDLSTEQILTMTFVQGFSIENASFEPQAVRDEIMVRLLDLSLREVFEFRQVQSDPNFANFTYDRESRKIGLLDFGATRSLSPEIVAGLRELLRRALAKDRDGLRRSLRDIGILDRQTLPKHQSQILSIIMVLIEAIGRDQHYAFANDPVFDQVRDAAFALGGDPDFQTVPHADILFLQRKVAGLYLIGRRLGARAPVHQMLESVTVRNAS